MTPASTPPRLVTLILLAASSTFALNMFLPSLPQIAEDLEASYGVVSLSIGGFLAVTAVLQMILGPVSDRIGRRPVLLAALGVFALASLGCAMASNVWVFLTFRLFQGAMTAGFALSMAIVRDTRPQGEAAGLIGYISMAMAVAPMVGPVVGGLLDATLGWRANFYLYALTGAALFIWVWVDLGETRRAAPAAPGAPPDRATDLQRVPQFWAYAVCVAASTGAFYIFITGAPLVAQVQFGVSPAALGVAIGSITVGFAVGSFLSARLAPRAPPMRLILAGRLVACLGLAAGGVAVTVGTTSAIVFFASTVCVGLGNGLTMPSANAAILSLKPALAGSAAGWTGALVLAVGAALTSVTGAILPTDAPAATLLGLMFAASFAGWGAARFARGRPAA